MNNTSENFGNQEHGTSSLVILYLILVTLIITIVFGNSLVILAWIVDKRVRSPQNAYYVSLAFTDFLIGAFVLPLVVGFVYNINQGWVYGLPLCKTFLITTFSLISVSVYHLVIIAVDRYQTITEGISYLQRTTLRSVYERCAVIWVLGLTVSLPLMFDFDQIAVDPKGMKSCGTKKTTFWAIHLLLHCFIIPLCFIIRTYSKIYLEIKKRTAAKRLPANCDPGHSTTDFNDDNSTEATDNFNVRITTENIKTSISLKREERAIKTLTIIIGACVACWTPWFVFTCYSLVLPKGQNPSQFLEIATDLISSANSAINPIIYAFRHPEFRRAFQNILRIKCERNSFICSS